MLGKARKILGTNTIRETVEMSLQTVVRQKALNELADLGGKVEMIALEDLLKQRKAHARNVRR